MEIPVDDSGVDEITGQNDGKPTVALVEAAIVAVGEANIERRQHRQRGDDKIVNDDQHAPGDTQKSHHGVIIIQAAP